VTRVAWGALLCMVTFWGSTGLHRFYDDWSFIAAAALAIEEGGVAPYLVSPVGLHWSPLWNLLALGNFLLVGWDDDRLVRSVALLAQAGALVWFVRVGRLCGVSMTASMFGMAVFALHPVRAAALYSFDTYSQVLVDLGSWVAAGLALQAVVAGRGLRDRRLAAAVLIPLLCLPLKEQALAGAAAVWCVIVVACARTTDRNARRRGVWLAGALATGVVAFAVARHDLGVTFTNTEAYRLCLACVPRNIALIGGSLVLPVRTLDVVDAWHGQAWPTLALAALGAGLVVAFVRPALQRLDGAIVAILLVLAVFPVALLAHVGELYAHTATFWFAMLMAVAADSWGAAAGTAARRAALGVAAGVYLVGLGTGLRANLAEIRHTGELAATWRERYDTAVAPLPEGSVLLVRTPWPVRNPGDYSLYRLTSPDFVMTMWAWVRRTPADRRLEVIFEWSGDTSLDALASRARTEPVFELRRTPERFEVAPLVTGTGP
jgi:hypothetical protein